MKLGTKPAHVLVRDCLAPAADGAANPRRSDFILPQLLRVRGPPTRPRQRRNHSIAQGNALGNRPKQISPALKGAELAAHTAREPAPSQEPAYNVRSN